MRVGQKFRGREIKLILVKPHTELPAFGWSRGMELGSVFADLWGHWRVGVI